MTRRGVTVIVSGLVMWMVARLIGSPGLEVVGIGLGVLPFVAGLTVHLLKSRMAVTRHLSDNRVRPSVRVTVRLEVSNRAAATTPFLLLQDQLPPALGRPARLVMTGVRGRSTREAAYTILPQTRGRYPIGPLSADASDSFGLTRRRVRLEGRDELLVTPDVEDLSTPPDAASGTNVGSARARQLLRTGDEYFTMRGYQEGDDLRRIHWPSVARTGELMIRQDEATKRASGLVFLDDRQNALGVSHSAAFERAVTSAASVGSLFARNGFTLRFASSERPPVVYTEERFLEELASVEHGRLPSLAPALHNIRSAASPDTSLVFVGAPPSQQELPGLVRAGSGYGPKLAVLVHPVDPATAPPSRRSQLEHRATHAHLTLVRAGWDCIVLSPGSRLSERWHTPKVHPLASSA
jgi:uncharacterized protein (DUF58 family)